MANKPISNNNIYENLSNDEEEEKTSTDLKEIKPHKKDKKTRTVVNINEFKKDEQILLEKENVLDEYDNNFNSNRPFRNKFN